MYNSTLKKPNGQEYLIQKDDIDDITNSNEMETIRKRFLAGTQPRGCHRCWMEELSGKKSKRVRDNQKYQHHIKDNVIFAEQQKPRYLDLKLGNICNLKCRICSPQYSSRWITEQKRYDKIDGIQNDYSRLDWPEKSEHFWKTIEGVMPHLEHLDFTGGEPFMIKEHFALLEKIIDGGYAKNITLHYNSNGTQLPLPALKNIWPNFKYVDVHFSIDGIDKKFEYQRHPAKWQDAISNMSVFKEYQTPTFDLCICHTVNIFNVFYLPEFLDWTKKFGMKVYLNNLHEPKHYNITCLPYGVKLIIKQKLEEYKGINLNNVINFMMSGDNVQHFKQFQHHTTRTDIVRHETFDKVFPELSTMFQGVIIA